MRTLTAAAVAAAVLAACADPVVTPIDEDGAAFAAHGDDVIDAFSADAVAGWSRLQPVVVEGGMDRVGVRFDVDGAATWQAVPSLDDAVSWGEPIDLVVTYEDGRARNAYADLPADTTHVALRTPDAARVSSVAVEVFRFEPEPTTDDEGVDIVESAHQQGLAATGIAVSRAQWGARATSCSGAHVPSRITVHHTVTPNADTMSMPARMRQIQAFHIDVRGWCDVGYHFLVGQDGKVYQGRIETKVGAHAANANLNNAGVSFIGTFSSVAPATTMMNAGGRILKALAATYSIPLNRTYVKGHRQVGTTSTSCPGDRLYGKLDALIALATATPPVAPPPAPAVGTATWLLRDDLQGGNATTSFDYGLDSDVLVVGDFDGDGDDDPGVVRGGRWYLRLSTTSGVANVELSFGQAGDRPVVGDWDGDGVDTIGVVRGALWFLRNSNTTGIHDVTFTYGQAGNRPVAGDWDGDGIDTPGLVRGTRWYLRNSATTGVADVNFEFGVQGDEPLVGDWNGDGVDTPAVKRAGRFFLKNANTGGSADVEVPYGLGTDRGVVGDWDGDGDATPCVVR